MPDEIANIKEVLRQFQQGYLDRDLDTVGEFLDLFCAEGVLEVVGTNAYIKGEGEWANRLVRGNSHRLSDDGTCAKLSEFHGLFEMGG